MFLLGPALGLTASHSPSFLSLGPSSGARAATAEWSSCPMSRCHVSASFPARLPSASRCPLPRCTKLATQIYVIRTNCHGLPGRISDRFFNADRNSINRKSDSSSRNCMNTSFANSYPLQSSFMKRPEHFSSISPIGQGVQTPAQSTSTANTETESADELAAPCDISSDVSVVVVVGEGKSPYGSATWKEVMEHMAQRVSWIDQGIQVLVLPETSLPSSRESAASEEESSTSAAAEATAADSLENADVVVGVALLDGKSTAVRNLQARVEAKGDGTIVYFESDAELEAGTVVGGVRLKGTAPALLVLAETGIWRRGAEAMKLEELLRSAWSRQNADDIWFCMLALVNATVRPVSELQSLRATGLGSVLCMLQNCSKQVWDCFSDPNCRAAIQCLNQCGPTDQVCSYRCIVSYESPQLEAFSLCILQKHRCLGLSAQHRTLPPVHPMSTFRGQALTHETAEGIFTGWLGETQCSWRVAAGQNAAYDQFPCQFQVFYRGKAKGSFWYDPVFQVRKFDGELVWRRRHYRVRRQELPGAFVFSVLDNGVTSEEFWKIVDATDDLSWALFYYSGAAKAAGQAYTGAVLVTPDGSWPKAEEQGRLAQALGRCGIKEWEMYKVDNSYCAGPPLGLPDGVPEQPTLL